MDPIDEADESRRLTELYAQMSEEEIRALAEQVWDLSETAQQVLRAELSKRGLELELPTAPAAEPFPDGENTIDACSAKDMAEASVMKSVLDSAGIACWLVPESPEYVARFAGPFSTEVKIRVMKADLARAREVLAPYLPPTPEDNKEYVVRCPQCHSTDVVFQSLDGNPLEGPVANAKFNWTCDACGHAWKDEGTEEEA